MKLGHARGLDHDRLVAVIDRLQALLVADDAVAA
jgi:hypothetical protein